MKFAIAVNLSPVHPSLLHKFCLANVFPGAIVEQVLHPSIETTGVNAEHSAHHSGLEAILIGCNEGVLHFVFFAKYAAAFFRISRSSVTRSNSRFKRMISAA